MPPSVDGGANAHPLPLARLRLLADRWMAALAEARVGPADAAWARSVLTPAEHALWAGLPAYDRSHAVQVARRVERAIASTVYAGDTRWVGAALMHDVGKLQSNLSSRERMIATLTGRAVRVATARRWASAAAGAKRRIGSYLIHGEIGARMIRAAGGREEVAAWTEVHQGYDDDSRAGIPSRVVEALRASDVGRASWFARRRVTPGSVR